MKTGRSKGACLSTRRHPHVCVQNGWKNLVWQPDSVRVLAFALVFVSQNFIEPMRLAFRDGFP
jgi:hypothetical protein